MVASTNYVEERVRKEHHGLRCTGVCCMLKPIIVGTYHLLKARLQGEVWVRGRLEHIREASQRFGGAMRPDYWWCPLSSATFLLRVSRKTIGKASADSPRERIIVGDSRSDQVRPG